MRLPESKLLRAVLGWLLFAAFNSFVWACFAPASITEAVGALLAKVFMSGIAGGLSAGFRPTQFLSWIAVLSFFTTLVVTRCESLQWAQLSFAAFMLLSFITFWADALLVTMFSPAFSSATAEAMAGEAVSWLLQFLNLPLNIVLNGIWAFVWVLVARELQAEFGETPLRREHQQKVDELLQDAFSPSGPTEPSLVAVNVVDISCTVCQRTMPSTNRFCSRCGAPVSPTASPRRDSR